MSEESLSAEEAIERLAEALFDKMEHLDPSVEYSTWADLPDRERQFYITSVEYLLAHRELVETALT